MIDNNCSHIFFILRNVFDIPGLGLRPANERRRYFVKRLPLAGCKPRISSDIPLLETAPVIYGDKNGSITLSSQNYPNNETIRSNNTSRFIVLCFITDISSAIRDNFVFAPTQWETMLHCNVVSHWLGAHVKWPLYNVIYAIYIPVVKKMLRVIYLPTHSWNHWSYIPWQKKIFDVDNKFSGFVGKKGKT